MTTSNMGVIYPPTFLSDNSGAGDQVDIRSFTLTMHMNVFFNEMQSFQCNYI